MWLRGIDETLHRINRLADVGRRSVPNPDTTPVVGFGNVDDLDRLFDLTAMPIDRRPVGVIDDDGAFVGLFAHQGDMPMWQDTGFREDEDGAAFRLLATTILAVRGVPPLVGIAMESQGTCALYKLNAVKALGMSSPGSADEAGSDQSG